MSVTTSATTLTARRHGWLVLGLVGTAGGLVAVALLGPLASEVIDYRITETLRNQLIGLDAVSLFVAAPLAALAAALVLRRQVAGFALALGIGAYTAYMFLQYILGPDYVGLAGNNERLFPLALFLFATGWMTALAAWNAIDVEELPVLRRRDRVVALVGLPILAVPAFARYLPSLADWMSAEPEDEVYLAGPGFSWTIALLDLGVFLPLTVATCVGLARRRPWAQKALYTVAGWFGLVGLAVAGMAITMYVNDDPNASGGSALFMTMLGLAFVGLGVAIFRPLVRGGGVRFAGARTSALSLCAPLSGRLRVVAAAVAAFVGVGALFGGYGLLSDAEGLGAKEAWLEGTPFPDYRVPAVVLLTVVGGGMLVTAASALMRSRYAGFAASVMGATLVVWGVVESITIGYRGAAQIGLLAVFVVVPAVSLLKIGWDASTRHDARMHGQ